MGFLDSILKRLRVDPNELDEFYNDKKEIKTEEQSYQELARKLTYQLVAFWGAPEYMRSNVPKVRVVGREQYRVLANNKEANNLMTCIKSMRGNLSFYEIFINSEWIPKVSDEEAIDMKSSIAEEISHFIHFTISPTMEKNMDVEEFFGMISRLYIAEQSHDVFRGIYSGVFQKAREFSENKKKLIEFLSQYENIEKAIETCEKNGKMVPRNIFERMEYLKPLEEGARDELSHMSYLPASAWYFEVRKMTPEKRYKFFSMTADEIRRTVMEDAEKRLSQAIESLRNISNLKLADDRFFEGMKGETSAIVPAKSQSIMVYKAPGPIVNVPKVQTDIVPSEVENVKPAEKQKKVVLNVNMTEKEMKEAGIKF